MVVNKCKEHEVGHDHLNPLPLCISLSLSLPALDGGAVYSEMLSKMESCEEKLGINKCFTLMGHR